MKRLARLDLTAPTAALVLLCRREVPRESLATLPGFREPDFQAELATLAQRHGVFGLVLLNLERSGLRSELPAPVAQDYADKLRGLRRQAALWDLERDFVLGSLAARGIPAVLLKGAALRLIAYPDSVQRSFGDLDILVPEDSVDDSVKALSEAGYQSQADAHARLYREHHHHLILHKAMGFVVEVHWALEPVGSPFALDPAAFRRDAVSRATRQGQSIWVPSLAHNLLHLSTQSIEDGYSRFGRIVDLDRLIGAEPNRVDWDELAAEANRMRVAHVTALSFRLAKLLLGARIPAHCFTGLELSVASRANLALLDPIGVLLEQRSLRWAALERLLLLWCVSDRANRLKVLRSVYRGEQDWFAEVGLVQYEIVKPAPRNRRPLAMLKLIAYQLRVYLAAVSAWLRGRQRVLRFWSPALDGGTQPSGPDGPSVSVG